MPRPPDEETYALLQGGCTPCKSSVHGHKCTCCGKEKTRFLRHALGYEDNVLMACIPLVPAGTLPRCLVHACESTSMRVPSQSHLQREFTLPIWTMHKKTQLQHVIPQSSTMSLPQQPPSPRYILTLLLGQYCCSVLTLFSHMPPTVPPCPRTVLLNAA